MVESATDRAISDSFCCGGTRRLPSGDWLTSWGGNKMVAGYAPGGARTFRLTFLDFFSYRAFPVPDGRLSQQRLRTAMDRMYPRG